MVKFYYKFILITITQLGLSWHLIASYQIREHVVGIHLKIAKKITAEVDEAPVRMAA